jgi:hypothetical protein
MTIRLRVLEGGPKVSSNPSERDLGAETRQRHRLSRMGPRRIWENEFARQRWDMKHDRTARVFQPLIAMAA